MCIMKIYNIFQIISITFFSAFIFWQLFLQRSQSSKYGNYDFIDAKPFDSRVSNELPSETTDVTIKTTETTELSVESNSSIDELNTTIKSTTLAVESTIQIVPTSASTQQTMLTTTLLTDGDDEHKISIIEKK